MTISNYAHSEPLFIVIVRHKDANRILQEWAKEHGLSVIIEGHRMKLYDTRSLAVFQTQFSGDWKTVLIWDCWNKRHIYHD